MHDTPAELGDRGPAVPVEAVLGPQERRWVWLAGLGPAVLVGVLLLPTLLAGDGWSWGFGVVVFGGITGVTAAVVTFDRLQARHCPACGRVNPRRAQVCAGCHYDLAATPRFACELRHRVHLEPGLCDCGRRLQPLMPVRGLGREVTRMLWFGLWLLAVLVAVQVGLGLLG